MEWYKDRSDLTQRDHETLRLMKRLQRKEQEDAGIHSAKHISLNVGKFEKDRGEHDQPGRSGENQLICHKNMKSHRPRKGTKVHIYA